MLLDILRQNKDFNELPKEKQIKVFDAINTKETRKLIAQFKDSDGNNPYDEKTLMTTFADEFQILRMGKIVDPGIEAPFIDPIDTAVGVVAAPLGAARVGTNALLKIFGESGAKTVGRQFAATPGYFAKAAISNSVTDLTVGGAADMLVDNDHPFLASTVALAGGVALGMKLEPKIEGALDSFAAMNKAAIKTAKLGAVSKFDNLQKSLGASPKPFKALEQMDNLGGEFYGGFDRRMGINSPEAIDTIKPAKCSLDEDFLENGSPDNFYKNLMEANGVSAKYLTLKDYTSAGIKNTAIRIGLGEYEAKIALKKAADEKLELEILGKNAKAAKQEYLTKMKGLVDKSHAKLIDSAQPDQVVFAGESPSKFAKKVLFVQDNGGYVGTARITKAIDEGKIVFTGKIKNEEELAALGYFRDRSDVYNGKKKAKVESSGAWGKSKEFRGAKHKDFIANKIVQNAIGNERVQAILNANNLPFEKSNTESVWSIIEAHKGVYSRLKPGIDPESYKAIRGDLEALEDVIAPMYSARPRNNHRDMLNQLKELTKAGVIPKDMVRGYKQFFRSLRRYPDVELLAAPEGQARSGYSAFFNAVTIKNPGDVIHELGHWAWYNVLTKKDRLDFLDTLYGQATNMRKWNSMFPKRLMHMREMKKLVDGGKLEIKDYHRWMQWSLNPKELYAELINQHAFANVLSKDMQKSFVQRTMTLMKNFFNSVIKNRKGVPKELAAYVDKVFMPEFGQSRIAGIDRVFAKVQNSAFFIEKAELDGSMENVDPFVHGLVHNDKDALTVLELMKLRLLPDEEARKVISTSDKFAELRRAKLGSEYSEEDALGIDPDEIFFNIMKSGYSKFDLESMFGSFQQNMMKWFHGIDDGVDEQALHEINEWFHDLFKPMNRGVAMQFIRQDRGMEVSAGRYGTKVDPQTGLERSAGELEGARKSYGAKKGLQETLDQSAEDMIYRAFKREFEELDAMFNVMRLKKSGVDLSNPPARHATALDRDLRTLMDERFLPDISKSELTTLNVATQVMPQAVSAMFGIDINSENGVPIPGTGVYVDWNAHKWMTNFGGMGPMLSAFSLFKRPGKRLMGRYTDAGKEKFLLAMKNFDFKHSGELPYDMTKRVYQGFHPNEGMAKEVGGAMRKYMGEVYEIQRKVNEAAEHIQKNFSRTERIQMAEWIEQNGDYDLSGIADNVKQQAEVVQSLLGNIRERLIDAGFPREELERYGDRYLMRLYTRDRGDKAVRSSFSAVQRANAWKKISGSFLQRRGMPVTITNKGFENVKVGDVLYGTPTKTGDHWGIDWNDKPGNGAVKYEVVKNKKGEITFQRDYTRQERAELGEVTDIVPRIVEFGRLVTRDVALAKMFQRMEGMTDHVLDMDTVLKNADAGITLSKAKEELFNIGWEEVPHTTIRGTNVKRFGKLAGKMVSPDVMRALEMSTGKVPKNELYWRAVDGYQKALRLWKIGKTALNPGTHGRNWACNFAICAIDGREPLSTIKLGARHLREKDELFNRAIEAGMLDSTMVRSELGLDGFMRGIESVSEKDKNLLMKTLDATFARPGKKALRGALRAYEVGDEIFKMGVFAQEIAKGKSDEEAIAAAKRLFFDYRDVPSGVRFLRDTGIFPFCSYSYKIVELLGDVARKEPWKIAGLLGAYEMMDNFMYEAEYGKRAKAQERLQEEIAPEWMGKKAFGVGEKMSIHLGEYGNDGAKYAKKFDYGGAIPGGDITDFFSGFPFGTHPAVSIAYGLFAGKDAQLDREFKWDYEGGMHLLSKNNESAIKERVQFIASTLLPNLPYPGSYVLDKLGNALVAEGAIPRGTNGWTGKDYYGNDASIVEEFINFTGMGKIRRLYVEEEYNRKILRNVGAIQQESKRLRKAAKSSSTSEQEMWALERNIEERAAFAESEINRLEQMKYEAER